MSAQRVLVVDDEVGLAELYKEILEEKGFQVLLSHNGREAIERFNSGETYQFLLLDLVMPRLDGWQVLRFLGDRSQDARPMTIVMSGSDFRADLAEYPEITFLEKPFPIDRLFHLLKSRNAAA